MTSPHEMKSVSLKEGFAKVAVSLTGAALTLAIPACHFITQNYYHLDPILAGSAMGLGGYLLTTPLVGQSGGTLKDAFTKANRVIPALILGAMIGSMGGLLQHAAIDEHTRREADLKVATRLQPDEIISETAAEKFCMSPRGTYDVVKTPEGYDRLVTLAGQKRLIHCPK